MPRNRLGMMQTLESMRDGDKMAAGDGKATKEAVRVTKGVCVPKGKRNPLQQGGQGWSGMPGAYL